MQSSSEWTFSWQELSWRQKWNFKQSACNSTNCRLSNAFLEGVKSSNDHIIFVVKKKYFNKFKDIGFQSRKYLHSEFWMVKSSLFHQRIIYRKQNFLKKLGLILKRGLSAFHVAFEVVLLGTNSKIYSTILKMWII